MIAMIMIYTAYFKKKVDRCLIQRTKDYFTSSYDNCVKLWEFGGIVLVNAQDKKSGCVSPEGDWKEFVVRNFADYMVETENTPADKAADNEQAAAE